MNRTLLVLCLLVSTLIPVQVDALTAKYDASQNTMQSTMTGESSRLSRCKYSKKFCVPRFCKYCL